MSETHETKMKLTTDPIALRDITCDSSIQPRQEGLDEAHITALTETGPEAWPPLVVVRREDGYVLVDGWHRLEAGRHLELEVIACEVYPDPEDGDLHALAFALNKDHGKPLTLADRKAEATRLVRQSHGLSDRELARRCGLDPKTIGTIRKGLEATEEIPQSPTRQGGDGKVRTSSPRRSASTSPTQPPDPSFTALLNIVDRICRFLVDHAGDELGDFTAKEVLERWPDRDRAEIVRGMRTLIEQLTAAADRLVHHTSEEPAIDREEAA